MAKMKKEAPKMEKKGESRHMAQHEMHPHHSHVKKVASALHGSDHYKAAHKY